MPTPSELYNVLDNQSDAITTYQHHMTHWVCLLDHDHGYSVGYGDTKEESKANAWGKIYALASNAEVPFKISSEG